MKKVILVSLFAAFLSVPTVAHDCEMVQCVKGYGGDKIYQAFVGECPGYPWREV